jgi:hypothetical protein
MMYDNLFSCAVGENIYLLTYLLNRTARAGQQEQESQDRTVRNCVVDLMFSSAPDPASNLCLLLALNPDPAF